MDTAHIIESIKSGHTLNNRGTGWWLSAPKRAYGTVDAVKIDDEVINLLEAAGSIRIVMLTSSMRAELT